MRAPLARSVVPDSASAEPSVEPQKFVCRGGRFWGHTNGEHVIAGLASEPVLLREVLAHQWNPLGKRVPTAGTFRMR